MFLDLNELNVKRNIDFEYIVNKDNELDSRIIDLKNSLVTGRIYIDNSEEVELECNFSGTMILKDTINLEEIPYEFNININESLNSIEENYLETYDFSKNILDLKRILWQNIVLEVPISYTKVHDAKLSGDGWELISDEKLNKEVDPRLKKLEELLERRD